LKDGNRWKGIFTAEGIALIIVIAIHASTKHFLFLIYFDPFGRSSLACKLSCEVVKDPENCCRKLAGNALVGICDISGCNGWLLYGIHRIKHFF